MSETVGASASGRLRAAWALVLLAPVCAELTFTAVAVPVTWLLLPLLLVMYGAGVLLVRELVVRAGGGWPSLAAGGPAGCSRGRGPSRLPRARLSPVSRRGW
ncbi:hypothetical protein [Nocardia thraciensis]